MNEWAMGLAEWRVLQVEWATITYKDLEAGVFLKCCRSSKGCLPEVGRERGRRISEKNEAKWKKNPTTHGASLVAQWLRIHLPVQGTQVQALVREDPTCHGATKPVHHNYWAWALEPAIHNCWAHKPQLLKPTCLEPVLHNKRSHCSEKPVHRNEE